ncbi:MAG TPA: 2-hydroxychromene-2-carboxylate isomerase [Rhodospirillaceae bacterium]|nr:2-hydroxychromene-2-carboxylate isomerase [Rhodospirillaceae bacterium]
MSTVIRYFYNHSSPWSYFGHNRFLELAAEHGAEVVFRPCESHIIFAQSGGLPVAKRAPQRQAYRIAELKRWGEYLGLPMVIESAHEPPPMDWANRLAIAAGEEGEAGDMGKLSAALFAARWVEDRDLSDPDGMIAVAGEAGFDGKALWEASRGDEIGALYDAYTKEAMDANVFGAPSYILDGELYWGQDRLDFLARALERWG